MPYAAEISRTNPTCFVFLLDQSSSMAGPFAGRPGQRKADGVADALNRLLQNLVLKCAKSEGVRDYFHVGVLGYADKVGLALPGQSGAEPLVPVSTLANYPLRVEQRTRTADDGAGGLVQQSFKFPVWVEPAAGGKTAMCKALTLAAGFVGEFVRQYPGCYPPAVVNVTDGKATDGDPAEAAARVRAVTGTDGNVLLFNVHLSSAPGLPVEFPGREDVLADPYAKLLYRMSSPLPPRLVAAARDDGFPLTGTPRGFVFNADLVSVIRFLDIGTRVAQTLR